MISAASLLAAARYKESGNKFVSLKRYSAAAACYRRGLEEFHPAPSSAAQDDASSAANESSTKLAIPKRELASLEAALHGNLALALLKMAGEDKQSASSRANAEECIDQCSLAIRIDPDNAKIVHRRGQARLLLAAQSNRPEEWDGVEQDFTTCLRLLKKQMHRCEQQTRKKEMMQQIKDAKKSMESLKAARIAIDTSRGSPSSPTPLTSTQATRQTDDGFPWDVPTLLKTASTEPLPMGGCIVRAALTPPQQRVLYQMLLDNVDESSEEYRGLQLTSSLSEHHKLNPDNRPQPLVTWVHPYTRLSNALERPTKLLRWAEEIMHTLAPESNEQEVDSMLAQLYALDGSLLKHRDEDLSWGVGVSLGSNARFDCLPDNGEKDRSIVIRSGDIVVGEFGKMAHAVEVPTKDNEPPSWWRGVDHFGSKMRCNVLFRKALSAKQQRTLAEERAQKVYGVGLEELRAKTGKDEPYLSVHLRHLALE